MKIYECNTLADYRKIAEFIERQSPDSIPFRCWNIGMGGHEFDWLKKCKEMYPDLHYFIVEDDENQIRAVVSAVIEESVKPTLWKDARTSVRRVILCQRHEDYVADIGDYWKGFIDWFAHYAWENYRAGGVGGFSSEKGFKWAKEQLGDAIEILEITRDEVFGNIYQFSVNLMKYLGVE